MHAYARNHKRHPGSSSSCHRSGRTSGRQAGKARQGNNADTPPPPRYLPIHHPTRAQQAARNATQPLLHRKNPIKRRAPSSPAVVAPSPTQKRRRLRPKNRHHTRPNLFLSTHRRLPSPNPTPARRASRRQRAGIYARKPRKTLLLPPLLPSLPYIQARTKASLRLGNHFYNLG